MKRLVKAEGDTTEELAQTTLIVLSEIVKSN
jgi:hypothetical protein